MVFSFILRNLGSRCKCLAGHWHHFWNWGKWGLMEYKWKGSPSMVGSLGLLSWYKRFCPALAALVGQAQKKNFLTAHCFISKQAGRAVVPRRLSPNMSLWTVDITYLLYQSAVASGRGALEGDHGRVPRGAGGQAQTHFRIRQVSILKNSVPDPWHFDMDPDMDPYSGLLWQWLLTF